MILLERWCSHSQPRHSVQCGRGHAGQSLHSPQCGCGHVWPIPPRRPRCIQPRTGAAGSAGHALMNTTPARGPPSKSNLHLQHLQQNLLPRDSRPHLSRAPVSAAHAGAGSGSLMLPAGLRHPYRRTWLHAACCCCCSSSSTAAADHCRHALGQMSVIVRARPARLARPRPSGFLLTCSLALRQVVFRQRGCSQRRLNLLIRAHAHDIRTRSVTTPAHHNSSSSQQANTGQKQVDFFASRAAIGVTSTCSPAHTHTVTRTATTLNSECSIQEDYSIQEG
mmetsp:Transcript_25570/g.75582  ORF Transcript_25570/g.75582 Transcript_25570/m.75582 type:complete len:279 (-) Transcript_25570:20-856(-)